MFQPMRQVKRELSEKQSAEKHCKHSFGYAKTKSRGRNKQTGEAILVFKIDQARQHSMV
jgi:hypothetical protein